MMQSEFYERTKVNLTGEEYAEVEDIYNSVQMDKDEFCKLWLKNRDNKIIAELMNTIKKLEDDCRQMSNSCESLTEEMEGMKAQHEGELQEMSDTHKAHMEDFGRKMIIHMDDDTYRYDDICEEFGFDFVCQVKLEEDIDLDTQERAHLVKMLKPKRVVG